MAISDKLNYLIETKQLFKDRLNSLGAEITNSTTFRNYLTWLDTFYNEVSDKTDLSENGVVGRTSQDSTTGKNLFGFGITAINKTTTYRPNATQRLTLTAGDNVNEVKFNYGSGSYCMGYFEITNIDGTLDYTISFDIKENTTQFAPTVAIDRTNSTTDKLVVIVNGANGSTRVTTNDYFILNNIQVELGSTATDFEPFTNGASPNPDYPQPINNLSGDVHYKVSGKNLFDKNSISNNEWLLVNGTTESHNDFCVSDYIPIKENTDYYLPMTNTRRLKYYNSEKQPLTTSDWDIERSTVGQVITTPNNANYVRITIQYTVVDINTFQFEQGSTATSYEPYIEPQTFNIPLGDIELCKIDTYKDKIYSSNGRFYLNKNIDKKFENSFTTILTITSTLADNLYGYACNIRGISSYSELGAIISNIFVPKILGSQTDTTNPNNVRFNMGIAKHNYASQVVITIDKKYLDTGTTTEFSNFLNNNNFEFYCVLATPTTTEITQENYPSLYNALKQIQDYLTAYKINKEFILGYSSPEIEY